MVQKTEQTILQRKPEYIEKLEQGIFDALFFTRDDRKFITDADGKPVLNPNFGKPLTREVDGEQLPIFGGLLGGLFGVLSGAAGRPRPAAAGAASGAGTAAGVGTVSSQASTTASSSGSVEGAS